MNLDRIDVRILRALMDNGELSNLELAERVGLSASPCSRRVRALEDQGVIRSRIVEVDAKALGLDLMALVNISMDRHTPDRFQAFEAAVKTYPEVLECLLIAGSDADYQLKVIVKDMQAYQRFLLDKLTRIEGVSGVNSSFVMSKVIDSRALPLGTVDTN